MAYDNDSGYMDEEAAPSESEGISTKNMEGEDMDEKKQGTEDQQALIPKHLFPEEPKPGEEYIFKVDHIYENEVAISYSYDEKKGEDKKSESEGMEEPMAESEPEDQMMM